jgi:hypothetical protein
MNQEQADNMNARQAQLLANKKETRKVMAGRIAHVELCYAEKNREFEALVKQSAEKQQISDAREGVIQNLRESSDRTERELKEKIKSAVDKIYAVIAMSCPVKDVAVECSCGDIDSWNEVEPDEDRYRFLRHLLDTLL